MSLMPGFASLSFPVKVLAKKGLLNPRFYEGIYINYRRRLSYCIITLNEYPIKRGNQTGQARLNHG
jgi:hypothetical protein